MEQTNTEYHPENWREWLGETRPKQRKGFKWFASKRIAHAYKLLNKMLFCIENGGFFGEVIEVRDWETVVMARTSKFLPKDQWRRYEVNIWDIRDLDEKEKLDLAS